jgi:hypothetical protein
MRNSRLDKIKPQTPVSILIHGGNRTGYLVTRSLIEQGCHVKIIDNYNSQTSKYISELKSSKLVDFFEFKGLKIFSKVSKDMTIFSTSWIMPSLQKNMTVKNSSANLAT